MSACSSIRFPSPMTMGPASAMMRALGWITVRGPAGTARCHPSLAAGGGTGAGVGTGPLPMVTSPRISLSTHTTAPGAIFTLWERGAVTAGPPRDRAESRGGGAASRGGCGRDRGRTGRDRGGSGGDRHSPLLHLLRHGRGQRRLRGAELRGWGRARPRPLLTEHREHREPREGRDRPQPPQVGKGARKGAGLSQAPLKRDPVPSLEAQRGSCVFVL